MSKSSMKKAILSLHFQDPVQQKKIKENMENKMKKLGFEETRDKIITASPNNIGAVIDLLKANIDEENKNRPIIGLGHGDPSSIPCFRTASTAEDAIVDSVRSAKFNGYAPTSGLLQAKRAIAEYLSRDLPCQLSPNDVYVTVGCKQAIDIIIKVLARSGANILLPKPAYPRYETQATFHHLDVRYYDLILESGCEVNLDTVEAIADENTLAIVIINPGNPCGNVYTYQHLNKVAETARKLGILVIADEVYGHLAFGSTPFMPMAVFGETVPVITLGSVSKRWAIPGWRLGWLVITDFSGNLNKYGILESIKTYLTIAGEPATFIQGAIPQILEKTTEDFYSRTLNILRKASDICYDRVKEIQCLTCPHKPQGSMFAMVKLDLSLLEDINDDMEFCLKLAKEESVIILPGVTVGLENWLRMTFATEPTLLEDGLERIKNFCQRHAKKQ